MRASLGVVAVAVIAGAMAACNGSPTSPGRCDDHMTASYADVIFVSGTVTSISFVGSLSETRAPEIVHIGIPGSGVTEVFTVTSATAMFERIGTSPPTATSACRIAIGQQVQISSGFGDVGNILPVQGASVPLPPTIGQVVILR